MITHIALNAHVTPKLVSELIDKYQLKSIDHDRLKRWNILTCHMADSAEYRNEISQMYFVDAVTTDCKMYGTKD